jgi:hypothetical protein
MKSQDLECAGPNCWDLEVCPKHDAEYAEYCKALDEFGIEMSELGITEQREQEAIWQKRYPWSTAMS